MSLPTLAEWIARVVRNPMDLAVGAMAVISAVGVAAMVIGAFGPV